MTRRGLVLKLLREAGERGVTTAEFLDAGCGSRYGGRVHELRRMGHRIEARRVRDGSWRYWLRHDAGVGAGPQGHEQPPGDHTHASPDPSDAEADVPVAPPATASLPADGGGQTLFDPATAHRPRGVYEDEDRAA